MVKATFIRIALVIFLFLFTSLLALLLHSFYSHYPIPTSQIIGKKEISTPTKSNFTEATTQNVSQESSENLNKSIESEESSKSQDVQNSTRNVSNPTYPIYPINRDITPIGGYTIIKTVKFSEKIETNLTPIDETTWVREIYGMCVLRSPKGEIKWSEGPKLINSNVYICEGSFNVDERGEWKLLLAIGYVNKTWNGEKWIIEEGIDRTRVVPIMI
jgi:hypothetical protein